MNSNDRMDKLVNKFDQLKRAQRNGQAFMDYNEGKIHFAPTYRLLVIFTHELPFVLCIHYCLFGKSFKYEDYQNSSLFLEMCLKCYFPPSDFDFRLASDFIYIYI